MSYKNDSNLVIANRFSSASSTAKAQMWETYDRLRDLTVSGSGTGTGFESAGGLLYNLASLLAPSSFATVFGGSGNNEHFRNILLFKNKYGFSLRG